MQSTGCLCETISLDEYTAWWYQGPNIAGRTVCVWGGGGGGGGGGAGEVNGDVCVNSQGVSV